MAHFRLAGSSAQSEYLNTPHSALRRRTGTALKPAIRGFAIIGILSAGFLLFSSGPRAQAATSSYLNFQARLLTNLGGVVPDGTYNIDFKLYNADSTTGTVGSCSGACLWEETRTNAGGHGVTVINGYFSVNLGSVTAFPSTINWDQPLWLTMNLTTNGTMSGAPSSGDWDGEMQNGGHSISLTALPYAFVAAQLAKSDGSGHRGVLGFNTVANNPAITLPDASGTVCLQADTACGFESTTGNDFIQNQTASVQTAGFNIDGTGIIGTALQAPLVRTADSAAGSTTAIVLRSGNETGSSLSSGSVTIQSGDASGGTNSSSGNIIIDSGAKSGSGTAGTISIGATNAPTVTIGQSTGATTIQSKTINLGASAGSGAVTNNGSTVNSTLALGNFASGGSIGSAATTVDIYTSISVNQTTGSQALTVPAPTASTTYGRLLYLSDVGTASFTLGSTTLTPGTTLALVWSNTNGGASWQYANGASGAGYVQLGPVAAQIDNTTNSSVNINKTGASGNILELQKNGSDVLTVDNSGTTNVSSGHNLTVANGATSLTDSSGTALTVNNSSGANPIAIFQDNGTAVATIGDNGAATFENSSNSSTAFQVQNSSASDLFNVNALDGYVINNGATELDNLVQNPSFESTGTTDSTGWYTPSATQVITADSANAHSGNHELQVTGNTTTHSVFTKYFAVHPGDSVYAEAWVKNSAGANGDGGIYLEFSDKDKGSASYSNADTGLPGTSYTKKTITTTVPAGDVFVRLAASVKATATTGTFYFDDFYLNKVNHQAPELLTNASTTAFQVQNSSSQTVLGVDTSNSRIFSTIPNGSSAVGFTLNTPSYSTSGAKLLSLQNNLVEKFSVDKDGNISSTGGLSAGGDISTTGNVSIATGKFYEVNGTQISSANLSNDSNLAKLSGTGPQTFSGNNKFTGTVLLQAASSSEFQVQNASDTVFAVDTSANKAILGQAGASGLTANLQFDYSGSSGSISLVPLDPSSTAYTINLPAENGTICTSAASSTSNCTNFASTTALNNKLNKGSVDTSSAAVTAVQGYLYGFSNTSSSIASGVIQLSNGNNTGNALYVNGSNNYGSGGYIVVNNTNASPSGYLFNLQASGTPVFTVDASGNVGASGNVNIATGKFYEVNGSQISSSNLSDGSNLAKLNAANTFTNTNLIQLNSATAFQVQNTSNQAILGVDTSNSRIFSGIPDGASAIGFKFNTPSYTTAGAKLLSLQNNLVEKFSVDKDGNVSAAGNINVASGKVYQVNGTSGTSNTCSSGQTLDAQTTIGGITTGGSCVSYAAAATNGYVQLDPSAAQGDNTANNSIFINKTSSSGNLLELQKAASDIFVVGNTGNITATGTYNTNTFSSTQLIFGGAAGSVSSSAGSLTLQAANGTVTLGSSTVLSAAAALTVQASGTSQLTLNTAGAGTVALGTTNSTAVSIGNNAASLTVDSNATANLFTGATARTINFGTGAAVQGLTVGSTNSTSTTLVQGGSGSTAIRLQTAGGASSTISIGANAVTNSIQIGTTGTNTGNTQTIGIGNTNLAGTTNVTIGTGTSATAGTTTVQAFGSLTLQGGSTTLKQISGANSTTLAFQTPTAAVTYSLQTASAGSYNICTSVSSSACSTVYAAAATNGYVQLAPTSAQADATTNNSVFINKTSGTGNVLELQKSASDIFVVGNTGNITATGLYNSNTFSSSALTFGAAGAATIQSASGQNMNLYAQGTTTLSLDSTGAGTVTIGANATTISLGTGTANETVNVGNSSGNDTITLGNNTGTNSISIGTNGSAVNTVTIGTTNSTSTTTINAGTGSLKLTPNGSSNTGVLVKPSNNSTAAFQVQPSGSTTPVLAVDTTNLRVGINVAAPAASLSINSGTSNISGLQFTQLTSASSTSSSYSQLLGVDSSGNVGLSSAGVALTSPALAYWDGLNDPTSGSQSYPLATLTGNATYVGGGNGVRLTQASGNQSGSMNWQFSQVPFEESQFQFKAGTGAADSTWFYGYADSVPTTEYGCNVPVASCNGTSGPFIGYGYLVYFSEYHNCIGISWGGYHDGNQCSSGGGNNPLTSVSASSLGITINDNNFHSIDIQILDNIITVRWDGRVILTYTDVYTRDTSHLDYGFASRTGGSNNTHYIKGLLVTKLGSNPAVFNVNDISPLTNDLQNTSYNMYWQNSTGDLGINTYTPSANLDVNGTTNLEGNVTLGSLGSGGTTSLCTNGSNVISTCSGGGGASGTAVHSLSNSNGMTVTDTTLGYYLSGADSSGSCFRTTTFNITGLSNTEGAVAYIDSNAVDSGCTSSTLSVVVQINGSTMSTVTNSNDGGTDTKSYIVMYINGSWRILGYGNTTSGNTSDTADYAEWIPYAGDNQPQAGDVLTIDQAGKAVDDSSAPYDKHLIGVVSTSPYQVGGQDDGHSVILALVGRVPVKVNTENGPIAVGDPLTSSSVPGEAMKATAPGKIIGTALESYDGNGDSNEIKVQLQVGYNDPTAGSGQLQGTQNITGDLGVTGSGSLQGGLKVGGDLKVSGGLNVTGASIFDSLQLNSDLNVAGAAVFTSVASQTMTVSGNLGVGGDLTAVNITLTGDLALKDITINGSAKVKGDVILLGKINTRQATIKTFTASKAVKAGSVVILDGSKGNEGQVTTTTKAADPRVIGVAVSDAAQAGDKIQVAIGGWVQVKVDMTPDADGTPPPPLGAGLLLVTSTAEGTVTASDNPPAGSILGKSTSAQNTDNNLIWLIITLQ